MFNITVGRDLLRGTLFKELCAGLKPLIVTDETVKGFHGKGLALEMLTIPKGEKGKDRDIAYFLIDELAKRGCGKDTVLIALGGGSICDVVGFVASIYMRGISLILIPTTFLAMVDAAIGGKTAVNTPFAKNLIGTFYHPKAVLVDLQMLSTLPEKELFNGWVEVLKMGLIYDPSILHIRSLNEEFVLKAIQAKLKIVEKDPTEQGLRRILNFGHTVAHALEVVSDYEMSHGEAVALGCCIEAHLSHKLGFLPLEELIQVSKHFHRTPLKLPRRYTRERFLEAMSHDKKKSGGMVRFVLIDQIGRALAFDGNYCRPTKPEELDSTLDWMESVYR